MRTNRILLLLVLWLGSLSITLLVIIVRRPAETTIIQQRTPVVAVRSAAADSPYVTSIVTPISVAKKSPPVRKPTALPLRARDTRPSTYPDVTAMIERARREVDEGGDDPSYPVHSIRLASDLIRDHTMKLDENRREVVIGCMRVIDFGPPAARVARLTRCAQFLEDAAR